MTITLSITSSVKQQGSSIEIECTSSTPENASWSCTGLPAGWNSSFSAQKGSPTKLTITVGGGATPFNWQTFTVRDSVSSANGNVFVVPSVFSNDDIVFVHGNDGMTYLLYQPTGASPGAPKLIQMGVTPDVVTNYSIEAWNQIKPPPDPAIATVTCYVLNIQRLKPGC